MFNESHPRPAYIITSLVLAVLCLAVWRGAPSAWVFVGLLAWYGMFAMSGITVWMFCWWLIDQRRELARLASDHEYRRHQLAADIARQITLMSPDQRTLYAVLVEQIYGELYSAEDNSDDSKQDYIPAHPIRPSNSEQVYNVAGTPIEHSVIMTWLDLAEKHGGKLPAIGDPKQRKVGSYAYVRPKLEAFTRYLFDLELVDWSRGNRAAMLREGIGRDDIMFALEQDRA